MTLNLGSLFFNATLSVRSGNPSWGTELGQRVGYKFTVPGFETIIVGMAYNAVPLNLVSCSFGKDHSRKRATEWSEKEKVNVQIAALFKNVYINGIKIGYPFLMLLVKEKSDSHANRRSIKYGASSTAAIQYFQTSKASNPTYSNDQFIKKACEKLGISEKGCWFIYEMDIVNQDELHFKACIVKASKSVEYTNSQSRSDAWSKLIATETKSASKQETYSSFVSESELAKYGLQCIFYGSPGTGKSHLVDKLVGQGENVTRVTFHPDSDYASFVGCYKPTKGKEELKENPDRIYYRFVPQAFTKAYIAAYENPSQSHFLVIEEINRGNCAQIFGDLFQLLDRKDGVSEYPIVADYDMGDDLQCRFKELGVDFSEMTKGDRLELRLPANLYIYATMNTSDQSLFPMDAAFKRRWNWKYVRINLGHEVMQDVQIEIGEESYKWVDFLRGVNEKIKTVTSSEDKQLGEFFVKPENGIISFDTFRSKVMFYLWQEVFKDEQESEGNIFLDQDKKPFTFYDLFLDGAEEKIHEMMESLMVSYEDSH
jgi:hypothetical protein